MIDAHVEQVLETALAEALEQLEGEQAQVNFERARLQEREKIVKALQDRITSLTAALSV